MAARLEQDAKRRAEKEPAQVVEKTGLPSSVQEIDEEFRDLRFAFALAFALDRLKQAAAVRVEMDEARGATALWDEAVASLGRSAGVLEELAESTGEAIARIAARGDRIDRIQKALLNALVASEADA